jgi:hypothetical protein
MSTAYLMLGVELKEVLKHEVKIESVTRYDEMTGKPYTKNITTRYWTLFGKEIDPTEDPNAYPEECLPKNIGLEIHSNGEEDCDKRIYVVGLKAASVADCNSGGYRVEEVRVNWLDRRIQEAQNLFEEQGYKGDIKLFLLMHESF